MPVEERYRTRLVLDIQGNECEVHDASERLVMRYDHDMPGATAHQASMEAGERWTLNDVAGATIRAWDSREVAAFAPTVVLDCAFLTRGRVADMPLGEYVATNRTLTERLAYERIDLP